MITESEIQFKEYMEKHEDASFSFEEWKKEVLPLLKKAIDIEQWIRHVNATEDSQYSQYDIDFQLAERYANYKTKELNAKIAEFRNFLKEECDHLSRYWEVLSSEDILNEYDNHFNIEKWQ